MGAGISPEIESARLEVRLKDGSGYVVDLMDDMPPLTCSIEVENESRELTLEETDFSSWRQYAPTGRRFATVRLYGRLKQFEKTVADLGGSAA